MILFTPTLFHRWIIGATLVLFCAAGCATIPDEAVTLNQEVGRNIIELQRAYTALLNEYFEQRRQEIDHAVLDDYLPLYMSELRQGLRAEGENLESLSAEQFADIVRVVVSKRDEMQAELEKTRVALLERIRNDFVATNRANAAMTAILLSAIDVDNATGAAVESAARPLLPNFQFDVFEKKFDEYLLRVGDGAGDATKFFETVVKPLLDK